MCYPHIDLGCLLASPYKTSTITQLIMSTSITDLIPHEVDLFTVPVVLLLSISFIIVQLHFILMLQFDEEPSNVWVSRIIRFLILLSVLIEFLDLSPIYLHSLNHSMSSIVKLGLIFGAHVAVTTLCYLISIIKVAHIADIMYREGRIITNYFKHLIGAVLLLVISFVGVIEITMSFYVLGCTGFVLYLYVLNCLRQSEAPDEVGRMFWSLTCSLLTTIVFAVVLMGLFVKAFNDQGFATAQTQSQLVLAEKNAAAEIMSELILVSILFGIVQKALNLISTGYWPRHFSRTQRINRKTVTNTGASPSHYGETTTLLGGSST
jgi:hypothetical protein